MRQITWMVPRDGTCAHHYPHTRFHIHKYRCIITTMSRTTNCDAAHQNGGFCRWSQFWVLCLMYQSFYSTLQWQNWSRTFSSISKKAHNCKVLPFNVLHPIFIPAHSRTTFKEKSFSDKHSQVQKSYVTPRTRITTHLREEHFRMQHVKIKLSHDYWRCGWTCWTKENCNKNNATGLLPWCDFKVAILPNHFVVQLLFWWSGEKTFMSYNEP